MTTTYTTTHCHICSQGTEPLVHDGKSFLICEDPTSCLQRVERLELAEYFRLQDMAKCLRERLGAVLKRQGALETKLGLYDEALAAHRAEVKRIEENTKC